MITSSFNPNVVKKGIYLYDNLVECDIQIVFSQIRYGSGDYEDPEEIANNQEQPTFYVELGSTTQRGVFNAGAGGYQSLAQAIEAAENLPGIGKSIKWLK